QVDSNLGPEVLRVSLSGDRPEDLHVIVNAVVAVFVRAARQDEQSTHQAKVDQVLAKKREYEAQLREKRATLQGLEDRYRAEALQTERQRRDATLQQLALLEKDLLQTQIDLKVTLKELDALAGRDPAEGLSAVSDAAVEDYLRQDARYQQLQTELLKVEQAA